MADNSDNKNLEWNIGKYRIDFIGNMTTEVRESFHDALKYPTQGRVKNYLDALETLYMDLKSYVDDDDWKEDIEDEIEDKRESLDESDPEEVLHNIKSIDQKIQDKRMDLGLDIPSKTSAESLLD